MKKHFLLAVLFVPLLAIGQEKELFDMSLEELMNIEIESVSKQTEKLSEAPMSVYVIDKEEFGRWGVRYLYETVQRVPGYSFYNTDYYGQYGVIARGFQSIWRFGYSVELMPLNDFGHMSFPVNFFKNMEISRGPGGLAWGSNANAGLMNVNLRDDLNGFEVVSSYGNMNYFNTSVMAGGKFDNDNGEFFIGYDIEGIDYAKQENAFNIPGSVWKENGQRPSQNITAKVKYKGVKMLFTYDQADHNSPYVWFGEPYNYNETSGQWEKTLLGNMWDDITADTGESPHDQLEFIAHRTEYQLPLSSEKLSVYLYHNYFKRTWHLDPVAILGDSRREIGFNLNYSPNERFSLLMGGDLWGRSRLQQHNFTHYYAQEYGINWFDNNLAPMDQDFSNFYAQGSFRVFDKLKLIAGLRVDYEKDAKDEYVFTGPRLGVVYSPTENFTVKYLYNRAPRRPQTNELFGNTPKPEVLSAHELVFFYKYADKLNATATFFYQDLKDMINRVDLEGGLNTFYNMGGISTSGAEVSLNYQPIDNLRFYYNASYFSTLVEEGDVTIDGESYTASEKHNSSDEALFVPKYTGFLGAEVSIAKIARVNLAWRAIYQIPFIEADETTESYANADFFDLSITSKKIADALTFSFHALNVLDSQPALPAYGEHAGRRNGTILPEGRRFYVKVSYDLPFK